MNSKTDSAIDRKTHSIENPTEVIIDKQHHRKSWFGKLLQSIVKAFEPHNEPIFWKKHNRQGNSWIQGYDPASNRSLEFGSEDESLHLARSAKAISMTASVFSVLGQNVIVSDRSPICQNFISNTMADWLK